MRRLYEITLALDKLRVEDPNVITVECLEAWVNSGTVTIVEAREDGMTLEERLVTRAFAPGTWRELRMVREWDEDE